MDFRFPGLQGGEINLAELQGKVVLVVNTASRCGFTPQYAGLEQLYRRFKDRGLVVIGVPCDDFGHQEPGAEAEIGGFCRANYGVSFPMTAKLHVKGPEAHPFFMQASRVFGWLGKPKWNFHKYLIGRRGDWLDYFLSATSPANPRLIRAVERALGR